MNNYEINEPLLMSALNYNIAYYSKEGAGLNKIVSTILEIDSKHFDDEKIVREKLEVRLAKYGFECFDHMISDGGTNLVDWYAVKSHIEKKSLLGLDEYWENEFSGTYPEFRNSYWS